MAEIQEEKNKVNTIHDIFMDFDKDTNISKCGIKCINIYKKQNKMIISLVAYELIKINDLIIFETYLKDKFNLNSVDIKIENLEIIDNKKQKRIIENQVIEKNWKDIIIYLGYRHPVTKILLNSSRIIINNNEFNIVLSMQGAKILEARNFNRTLEEFLKNVYERDFKVNITEDIDLEAVKKCAAHNQAIKDKIVEDALKAAKENNKDKDKKAIVSNNENKKSNIKDKSYYASKAKESKELKEEKEELGPQDEHSPWIIPHRPSNKEIVIKDKKTNVIDIDLEIDKIYINGEILNIETRELKKMPKTLVMMDVFDGTSTITCKAFVENDDLSYVLRRLKEVKGIQVLGAVKNDMYSQELSIMANKVIEGQGVSEKKKIIDDAEEKRTELHLHTKMSQMDGVIDEVQAVKRAMSLGHPGIAITDHDCCQSFPHVYGTVNDERKNAKKKLKAVQEKQDELNLLEEIVNKILDKFDLDKKIIDKKVTEIYLEDKNSFDGNDEKIKAEIELLEK